MPRSATMESRPRPSLLDRIGAFLLREPEDRDQLVELLHSAFERNLMDADALGMIEGVLQVSDLKAREIMVPRAQVDFVDINQGATQVIADVVASGHSRFPAVDRDRDNVVGVLLAKDLLRHVAGHESDLRDMLRPAVFIPESKRLNVLLKDFRRNRNHMAIVVNEYGGFAGIVTIEDVLEQIVGEIEDEYDFDDAEDNILLDADGRYRVKAQTEISDFNEAFGTDFSDEEYDTVGGIVLKALGRLPKRGEEVDLPGLRFRVLRADSRRLHALLVERLPVSE
jgi:magnesium and cobalt transporter